MNIYIHTYSYLKKKIYNVMQVFENENKKKHLKKRQRKPRMVSLVNRKLTGDLAFHFNYLENSYREDGARLFSDMHS